MRAFGLKELLAEREQTGRSYLEFLRVPALSMGVYHLQAGASDLQRPHTEDEVYYIIAGRARFQAGNAVHEVEPGAVLFVERALEHRFLAIAEDLTVLVFFAPPEARG